MTSNQVVDEIEAASVSRDAPAADGPVKGVAFAIPDLILAKDWAAFNDSRMVVRLDHASEDEEYEEVIEFHRGVSSLSGVILWRNHEAVFIQPLLGKRRRYASVAEALDSLLPKQAVMLTDIVATAWPFGALA